MHHAHLPRSTFYVPRILRLQAEIGGMFADNMDLLTLTRWRLTCKTNYEQSAVSLRRSLMSMLSLFVPSPLVVLDIITEHRAVFGGMFALAYVLRDRSILLNTLDIYASDYEFAPLCSSILENPGIRNNIINHKYSDYNVLDALRTLVSRVLTIQTSSGNTIRIHRSYTSSSTAPISRASCTALSNFVTAFSFGCSHPLLTLNRRALVTDQELPVIPIPDHELHDTLMRHDFSLGFSPTVWPEFRRPVPPHTGKKISRGSMALNLEDSERPNEGNNGDFDDAVHPVGYATETTVPEGELLSSYGLDSLQPAGLHPTYTLDDSSGWLTCFPVEGLTANAVQVAANVDQLGPGDHLQAIHATSSDNGRTNRQDRPPSPGASLNAGVIACTEIQDPCALYTLDHDDEGHPMMPQPRNGDAEAMFDSIYSLGMESLINTDACAPPSPMSRLLSVLDPIDIRNFQLPIGSDTPCLADGVSQTCVPTTDQQAGPTLARDIPGVDAPCVLDLPCINPTDTIEHGELEGYAEYQFTNAVDYTNSHPTIRTDSLGTSPGAHRQWTHDLAGYNYNETIPSDIPQTEDIPIRESVRYSTSSSVSPATHNDYAIHDTLARVVPVVPPCPSWSFNEADDPYARINGVAQTEPCDAQPSLDDPFLSHIRSLDVTTQTTPGHEASGHQGFDHPYHCAKDITSVSNQVDPPSHLTSPSATYTDAVPIPESWQPSNIAMSPFPAIHDYTPVGTDTDVLTPGTTIGSTISAFPLAGFADYIAENQQDYVADVDRLVDTGNTSTVQDATAPLTETGTLPAFENTPATGIHRDHQLDSPEGSEYEGDESDDYSNSADTDVYPPRPVECWRHRYVCPSQGRYFGDRGSFVDFFDPLRGGEQYCAQNNIAPFGPMVVWRVLSTFNCEEGCDMYDDVLEDGVTSIPVLIRRDPFGELRDAVSDRPMVGSHKYRSVSL